MSSLCVVSVSAEAVELEIIAVLMSTSTEFYCVIVSEGIDSEVIGLKEIARNGGSL